jgi:hypothetical protein
MKQLEKAKIKRRFSFAKMVKYGVMALVMLFILNLVPVFFYRPEVNTNPLPSFYKKGVYHLHSIFSDGNGNIDEITAAAAGLNLDFVILTDHGRPNLKSSASTSWNNNVLLIGGSELSLYSGHLAAMGYQVPDYIFPPEPQEAIDEIVKDNENGVCFISHPFDDKIPWSDWEVSGFTGLEVLSSYSEARRAGFLKLLVFPLKYLINSKYALLNTMSYPRDNINQWDTLNQAGQYYGIYALDAHARLPISRTIQLNFPTYKSMFEIMTIYVKLPQEHNQKFYGGSRGVVFQKNPPGRRRQETDAVQAASLILSSLKKGNFFNVIEGIAPANGFEAFFIEQKSGQRIEIGGRSNASQGTIVVLLPFTFETGVVLLKNGIAIEQKANKAREQLEFEVSGPGVYRLEVYVPWNHFHTLPWIMTNPFFLGESAPLPPAEIYEDVVIRKPLPEMGDRFKVEKNSRSRGSIEQVVLEEGEKITHFTFKLEKESPGDRNYWSAMAMRKGQDFTGYRGLTCEVRSDKKRRFWLEFRTGQESEETWYRHSFLVDREWRRVSIPFARFYDIYGEDKVPDLARVTSVFFSINNANAYPGTEGEIFIKNFGLY